MLDEYQNCQVCATQGENARDWKWMGTGASCLAKMKCHSSGAGGGALSAWLKTVNLLSLERHGFLKNLGDLTLNDFRTIK